MKKPLIALLLVAATGAHAETFTDYARVVRSEPIYDQVSTQSCRNVATSEVQEGGNQTGASLIGGLVGGALGSRIGEGNGRTAATIAGAIGGTLVGNELATRPRVVNGTRRECRDVVHDEVTGYRVTYEYHGSRQTLTLPYNPGKRIEMRVSAEPVINQNQASY
jgi:uncharacterized protein YcfJ